MNKTRRSCWIIATALGVALLGLVGCGGRQAGTAKTETPAADVIWPVSKTPAPIGIVRLDPGQTARVSLVGAASRPVEAVGDIVFSSDLAVKAQAEGDAILVTADKDAAGWAVATAAAKLDSGEFENLSFVVHCEAKPIAAFTYKPPAGKTPRQVYVAGEFNGWNAGRDPLKAGPDGVFRVELPLKPGTWPYKFVIDGEWTPDPDNPKRDTSGFNNSLVEVKGIAEKTFSFRVLSYYMPGASRMGGLLAELPTGVKLVPEKTIVIVNNRLFDQSIFTVDTKRGIIRQGVGRPSSYGTAEAFWTVVATDSEGGVGMRTVHFAEPGAQRSPRDEVLYYAVTDRFRDGDPSLNHPAVNPDLHPLANYIGGDWAGIREKIEAGYFDQLGVTTLWISPVNRNTQKVERDTLPPHRLFTSYHGYWPISATETNEQFGSMDDLRGLVRAAHEHKMAVLIDFVANHVHEDHPMFKERPDWAAPRDTPDGRPNIRLFDEFPFTTWFDSFLPTLDYEHNPDITRIMADNAAWWLRETGADGFRHDAVKHIPASFWRALTTRLNAEFPQKEGRRVFQVGETISSRGTINQFVGPDLLDGQFDFPLYFTLRDVLAEEKAPMEDLARSLAQSAAEYPPGAIMSPLLGNHDVIRFLAYADGDVPPDMPEKEIGYTRPPKVDNPTSYDKLQLAFAFLMSAPGTPCIYYGDERGMTGAHDPDNRRSIDWNAPLDAGQQATFDTVCALGRARRESTALRRGEVEILHADAERILLARISPDDTVVVALARNPKDQGVTLVWPAHWGRPIAVEPLVTRGIEATLDDNRLSLRDGSRAFGFWRVKW